MVDGIIVEALKEDTTLNMAETLEVKYTASEIESLTQKYHASVKTGVDEVDSVHISIAFNMGWQKKGTGHNYNSHSGHAYFIRCWGGKIVLMLVYSKMY